MKKIILFSFLLLFTSSLFSQNNFLNGYIITNEQDTIFGYVKDRKVPPFGKLYKKIRFKQNNRKLFYQTYNPYQISAYKIGNTEFISEWIYLEQVFLKTEYKSIPNIGNKHFLKVIYKDYLTYYQWEQEDPETDYIDAIDLFKRKDQQYFVRVTQGIFGLKKQALAKYFMDCPELVEKILGKTIHDPYQVAIFYNNWKKINK